MIILGLNYHHGDSSACILKDGKILSAVEEERFVGIKHCSDFPINSILYCLKENNIKKNQIDFIGINRKKNYNLLNKIIFISKSLTNFLNIKFYYNYLISVQKDRQLELLFSKNEIKNKVIEVPHHLSHVYSTNFFKFDNQNSLIFSFDGSGDFSSIEAYTKDKKGLNLVHKRNFPDSLGFFYTAFTQFLGFYDYGDEYKIMSLAAYGKPLYKSEVRNLISNKYPFKLNMDYFNLPVIDYTKSYPIVNKLYNTNFIKLFGNPRNKRELNDTDKNIACSFQEVFEETVLEILYQLKSKHNSDKIYLTGGCAFNSLLVGKIIESKLFDKVLLGPNPGDAGGAVGAANKVFLDKGANIPTDNSNMFLGNGYSNKFIEDEIINKKINKDNYTAKYYKNFDELIDFAVSRLLKDNLIFWFQDRMEWGPRALGNRSILANPLKKDIKHIINYQIKKREEFRPFAPVVIEEKAEDYFEMHGHTSEFMNIVFKAKNITFENYPGIVNVDNTSRVQTVNKQVNLKLYNLIKAFEKKTNCPMLINTSLNVKGPIAQNPLDALNYFNQTNVNCLVLNNWIIEKKVN